MNEKTDSLITAAFTIPTSDKARIDRMAEEQDPHAPNSSRIMREILKAHFAQLDAKTKSTESVAA